MARTALLASVSLLAATALPAVVVAPADAKPVPQPRVTAKAVTVAEAVAHAVVQLKLSAKASKAVKVTWMTRNGTAKAGSDYTSAHGTVTIKKGSKAGTITVPILNDAAHESTEAFAVKLTSKQAKAPASVKVTITDDDAAAPSALAGTLTVTRTGSGISFTNSTLTMNLNLVPTATPGEWRDDGAGTWSITGSETTLIPGLCFTPNTTTISGTGSFLTGPGTATTSEAVLALSGFDPVAATGTPALVWSGLSPASQTVYVPTAEPFICDPLTSDTTRDFSLGAPGATAAYTGTTGTTRGVTFSYHGLAGLDIIDVTGSLTPVP
jgi:hypothetical protein